ncbi:hypothetical protein D3C78_1092180 [compost metagenome]
MDADLHADGNRLAFGDLQQARQPVADAQAQQVEQQCRTTHHRGIVNDRLPVLDHRQDDGEHQKQRGNDLHRPLHARGKPRCQAADQHADGDRHQNNGEHLQHLGKLQGNGLVGGHEVGQ